MQRRIRAVFRTESEAFERDVAAPSLVLPEPTLTDFQSERVSHAFRDTCKNVKPDILLVEYVSLAYLVERHADTLPCGCVKYLDTHDVQHERCRRFHESGLRHWLNIEEAEERGALACFDVILAIQERDARIFRAMAPTKDVEIVGHATAVSEAGCPSEPAAVGFFGSGGDANLSAIRKFIASVWPLVKRRMAEARLRIYGRVCDRLNKHELPDDVVRVGFVTDGMRPYRECAVMVNPVHVGGGLKIKNVETLAAARPLVTTSVGAEGMEDGAGTAFQVCNTPDGMAEELARLLGDGDAREALGRRACAFAKARFSDAAAYGPLMRRMRRGRRHA